MKIADTSAQDVRIDASSGRKRWQYVAAIAASVALLGWFVAPSVGRWATASVSIPAERLRVATVQRGNLIRDVSVQGRVVAAISPTLYASSGGTITLDVEAGASVAEGQILARIDSPELTNTLKQAQASLQQQSVELDRQRIQSRQQALDKRKAADLAEVTLVAAEREKRRADQANAIGVIPVIDFEKAQDDLRNAEVASPLPEQPTPTRAPSAASGDMNEWRMK